MIEERRRREKGAVIASTSRSAFLSANSRSPVVRVQYRDEPKKGRHYTLLDRSTYLLDGQACHDIPEKWPEHFR